VRRRELLAAASLIVVLAVGACSAQAGDGPGASATTAPTTTIASPSPTTPVVGDGPRSPLADRVETVGSAAYDPTEHQAPARTPAGLSVTSIGIVDAPVRPVGVEPNGEMEIPPADEVGWYRFGAAPGEGSAVLAAHIAYDGVDGVFRRLDRLAPGDEVTVRFDDGAELTYRVRELATYDKDELPDAVFDRGGPDQLVIITCSGDFNPTLRSYESNVVAYADPVPA
jgi:LPXTG-site transpeptidase (sortase) family protein